MKSLILTWEQFQDHEVIYPFYRLKEEGKVDLLANKTDKIFGILGCNITPTGNLNDLKDGAKRKHYLESYHLLVIPGGVKAMEKIRQEKHVIDFIKEWGGAQKVIASTCSGAQLLISAKLVSGRVISGYYSMADDISNAGATYVNQPAVVDNNIITSPHYDFMAEWLAAAIKVVQSRFLKPHNNG